MGEGSLQGLWVSLPVAVLTQLVEGAQSAFPSPMHHGSRGCHVTDHRPANATTCEQHLGHDT
jgi:hypothetical protein